MADDKTSAASSIADESRACKITKWNVSRRSTRDAKQEAFGNVCAVTRGGRSPLRRSTSSSGTEQF